METGPITPTEAKAARQGRRELPQPAVDAIKVELKAFGKDLTTMKPEESLWPSRSPRTDGITSGYLLWASTAVFS